MEEIEINGKKYILKDKAEDYQKKIKTLKQEIINLKLRLDNKKEEVVTNKYHVKYKQLYTKYRTLYTKYKQQSDRHAANRQKYVEIIHKLQCEIINQAGIEELIKEIDRMAEIELKL